MDVRVDAAGNLRGVYRGAPDAPRLFIGSHLDTVPDAGAFDGILGVVLGIALVERSAAGGCRSPSRWWLFRRGRRALRRAVHRQPRARRQLWTTSCWPAWMPTASPSRRPFATSASIRGRSGDARVTGPTCSGISSSTSSRGRCSTRSSLPLGVVDGHRRPEPARGDLSPAPPITPARRRWTCAAMRSPGPRSGSSAVERDARATPELVATVGALRRPSRRHQRDRRAMPVQPRRPPCRRRGAPRSQLRACADAAREIAARRGLAVDMASSAGSARRRDGSRRSPRCWHAPCRQRLAGPPT